MSSNFRVTIDDKLNAELDKVLAITGRTKTSIVIDALTAYVDGFRDADKKLNLEPIRIIEKNDANGFAALLPCFKIGDIDSDLMLVYRQDISGLVIVDKSDIIKYNTTEKEGGDTDAK